MRFTQSLLVACALALSSSYVVDADLRQASQPTAKFAVKQRNTVQFVDKTAIYMEPSDFKYAGLKQQRDGGAYDNFLRSNIDNEQDKRNFGTEDGRDMLPFRTFEATFTDVGESTQKNKIGTTLGGAYTATPGTPFTVPLRWNNPHASEIEANVWITVGAQQFVVPVSKPSCSGEGHQDNVLSFTIPTDFVNLGSSIPGFQGCKTLADKCVLQIYAHSVETRQYAIGTPLIVPGTYPAATATDTSAIKPAPIEVGTDLTKLKNDICLDASKGQSDIKNAVAYFPRLISDQYNHAYQNSDYSPYSGQQPLDISKNLQAAAILSMVTGNFGELGKAYMAKNNPTAAALAAKLETKQKNLIKQYEGITNNIIDKVLKNADKNGVALAAAPAQKLANCFRCAEVGSVTTTRQNTNTYVPSFQIPAALVADAQKLVPAQYKQLINKDGLLQIYVSTLNDLNAEFVKAEKAGVKYKPAALKPNVATLVDDTKFKKIDAAGKRDNGLYAATKAYAAYDARQNAIVTAKIVAGDATALTTVLEADVPKLPETLVDPVPIQPDMDSIMTDDSCDDETKDIEYNKETGQPLQSCTGAKEWFVAQGVDDPTKGAASHTQTSSIIVSLLSIAAALFIRA